MALQATNEGPSSRWTVASALSAVGAALLAAACCLGPLLFAALGIGGAGLLLALQPYRPYFIGVTVALLGAGFFMAYRRPRSAVGCACEYPRANRVGRILLWVATAIVAALLAFPYLAPVLFR